MTFMEGGESERARKMTDKIVPLSEKAGLFFMQPWGMSFYYKKDIAEALKNVEEEVDKNAFCKECNLRYGFQHEEDVCSHIWGIDLDKIKEILKKNLGQFGEVEK